MGKSTINDVDVQGKRILMRVDFNVPVEDGAVVDDRRIRGALDSIRSVLGRGGRLVLIGHRGRPRGEGVEPELSLRPCADCLAGILGRQIEFADDCVGQEVWQRIDQLRAGEILLLENLRFHKEEVLGNPAFARQLADLADVYCNEAFSVSHRAHASIVGVPRVLLESDAGRSKPRVAGLHLERELRYLSEVLSSPQRPFVAILGGVKMDDRVGPVLNLLDRLDVILIGGALAYAFMAAEHKAIGESLIDRAAVKDAARVLHAAAGSDTRLMLPVDHICGKEPYAATPNRIANEVIPNGWMGLDIGPRTVVDYAEVIRGARTIFWMGPMGAVEAHPFDVGTKEIILAITHATQLSGATSIVGGSDSAMLLQTMGLGGSVSHVTTSGAATLAMLEGRRFEGLELLDDKGAVRARGAELVGSA